MFCKNLPKYSQMYQSNRLELGWIIKSEFKPNKSLTFTVNIFLFVSLFHSQSCVYVLKWRERFSFCHSVSQIFLDCMFWKLFAAGVRWMDEPNNSLVSIKCKWDLGKDRQIFERKTKLNFFIGNAKLLNIFFNFTSKNGKNRNYLHCIYFCC